MLNPTRAQLIAAWIFICSLTACGVASGQESMLRRWALVATPEAAQDGLPDLLTARLSQDAALELVERAQIQLVTRELELSTVLSAMDPGERLKLGRTVSADALLLLSLEERNSRQVLKVTICECRFGARLRQQYFPYAGAQLTGTVEACGALVAEVRRHFEGGISHLVGIPPFLSQNLTRQYDHLQVGYAQLLEQALWAVPGVAVIEFEEARAIQQELDLSRRSLERRTAALIVEGQFQMHVPPAGQMPVVDLELRLVDGGDRSRSIVRRGLAIDAVPGVLTVELPAEILPSDRDRPRLDRQQQLQTIARRADQFGDLGIWERSTQLREAVLLLDPGHVEQRLMLLDERQQLSQAQENAEMVILFEAERDPKQWAKQWSTIRERRRSDWRIRMQHVEYLIRNRLINPREAGYLIALTILVRHQLRPEDEDLDLADDFFWRMFRSLPQLDYSLAAGKVRRGLEKSYDLLNLRPELWSQPQQLKRWVSAGYTTLADGRRLIRPSTARENPRTASQITEQRTLDDLYRFFIQIVPDGGAPGWLELWESEYGDRRYRELYERLAASEHTGAQIFGRYRLLAMDVEQQSVEPDHKSLAEADSLLQLVGNVPHPVLREYRDPLLAVREKIINRIGRQQGDVARHYTLSKLVPYQFDTLGRVAFQRTGLVSDDWLSIERCRPDMDLVYGETGVYVIRPKGTVKTIWSAHGKPLGAKYVYEARWDGKNIWIALTTGGVLVVSPEGSLVARFGSSSGLPPYRETIEHEPTDYLLLHPLESGRALAIGHFAQNDRVWFAVLDARPGAVERVKVFHRLTKLRGQRDDPELISSVCWLKPYQITGEPQKLLVKRQAVPDSPYPLIINPETLEVTVHSVPFDLSLVGKETNRTCQKFSILPDGTVLHPVGFGIERFAFQQGWNWRQPPNLFLPVDYRGGDGWIERGDSTFYVGGSWYRVDPHSLTYEALTNGLAPYHCQFDFYGLSAHYGLVAWNRQGPLVRVLIDEPEPPDIPPAAYDFVPAANRPQHTSAAHRLSELGAIVGPTVCREELPAAGPYPNTHFVREGLVYLTPTWRGGRVDVQLLAGLHGLRELEFRQAAISDEQIAELPRLETLTRLVVYETQLTDKGLAELTPDRLPNLEYLRIEDSVGQKRLTDAGLRQVVRLPKLKELMLYGAGFTDAGLEALAALPENCHLQLNGTRITRTGLAALRQKRPDISWRED